MCGNKRTPHLPGRCRGTQSTTQTGLNNAIFCNVFKVVKLQVTSGWHFDSWPCVPKFSPVTQKTESFVLHEGWNSAILRQDMRLYEILNAAHSKSPRCQTWGYGCTEPCTGWHSTRTAQPAPQCRGPAALPAHCQTPSVLQATALRCWDHLYNWPQDAEIQCFYIGNTCNNRAKRNKWKYFGGRIDRFMHICILLVVLTRPLQYAHILRIHAADVQDLILGTVKPHRNLQVDPGSGWEDSFIFQVLCSSKNVMMFFPKHEPMVIKLSPSPFSPELLIKSPHSSEAAAA